MTNRFGLALAVALAVPAASTAQESGFDGFYVEIPVGLATPLGEANWEGTADPSVSMGAQVGWLFGLGGWTAAIGPELSFRYSVVNVEDREWGHDGRDDDVYIGRLGITGGARFVVGFGSAYMLGRVGVGMDFAHASWDASVYDGDEDDSDVGAAMLVGVGMGYNVTDMLGISVLLDFPIGFHDHDAGPRPVDLDGDMLDLLTSAALTIWL